MQRAQIRILTTVAIAVLLLVSSPVSAQISLGTSQSFAALGASTVTNTGATTINGNVGVWDGTAVTGFPPGVVVGGTIHAGNAVAQQAQLDLDTAYDAATNTACTVDLTGQDLGGLTLTPGVYCFSTSAFLTGTLTLDFQGNPNALFLFKTGTTVITAGSSAVVPINNGGSACPPNVFWRVGSSATFGTFSTFTGNVLAQDSITLTTGANLNGRALARTAAVTLDTNAVAICAPAVVCQIITVNPATLPNSQVGSVYNQAVTATGGTAPYTFAVTSGSLPTGLTLSAAGAITGTPTAPGTFNFTITATDAGGCFGSRAYSIVIAAVGCPLITLSPAVLPPGVLGSNYNQTVSASGGLAPYTFNLQSGTLPTGLILGSTGTLSGTPSAAGIFTFTIRAMDANACPGLINYSVAIVNPPGIPTLDFWALALLIAIIGGAGYFLLGRTSI